jgi:hypothetical protein
LDSRLTFEEPVSAHVYLELLVHVDALTARKLQLRDELSQLAAGESKTQGQITKTGSTLARRLLVEVAWHYGPRPSIDRSCKPAKPASPSTCSRSPTKPNTARLATPSTSPTPRPPEPPNVLTAAATWLTPQSARSRVSLGC